VKIPPATLCSWGRAAFATNNVPQAKIKSTPHTDRMKEGKPYVQYGDSGLIMANKNAPKPVAAVPKAI